MKTSDFNKRLSSEFALLIELARRTLEHRPINNLMADSCEADRDDFHGAAKAISKALTKLGQGRPGDANKAIREAVEILSSSGSPKGQWHRTPSWESLQAKDYALHFIIAEACKAHEAQSPRERLEVIKAFLSEGESRAVFYLSRARAEGNHRDYTRKTDKGRQSLSWNVKGALTYLAWAYREGTGREPTVTPHKETLGSTFSDMIVAFCEEVQLEPSAVLRLADEHRELIRALPPQWEDIPPDPDNPWARFMATGKRLVLPKMPS